MTTLPRPWATPRGKPSSPRTMLPSTSSLALWTTISPRPSVLPPGEESRLRRSTRTAPTPAVLPPPTPTPTSAAVATTTTTTTVAAAVTAPWVQPPRPLPTQVPRSVLLSPRDWGKGWRNGVATEERDIPNCGSISVGDTPSHDINCKLAAVNFPQGAFVTFQNCHTLYKRFAAFYVSPFFSLLCLSLQTERVVAHGALMNQLVSFGTSWLYIGRIPAIPWCWMRSSTLCQTDF